MHDVSENGTGVGETRRHVAGGSEGVQGMPVVKRSEMAVAVRSKYSCGFPMVET